MKSFWDERYDKFEYIYGTNPNDFLAEVAPTIAQPKGKRALCLADGEGRNGVYLAKLGFDVTSVDLSIVGLRKAQKLAKSEQQKLTTIHADLANFDLGIERYDLIVSIFAHFPEDLRKKIHKQIPPALRPGGSLILEAYTPANVGRGVGGPPTIETAYSSKILTEDFEQLLIQRIEEREREIHEGSIHKGLSAIIQLLACKKR
ncbi:class I SAM-dependent methyltransferase [Coraliomargarita sp. SDUM461004]|uniref:Class I SAM-dependent methyltransferase n=1 Tax=Thalassobacterium sedimentorum TaxID=3041258 RepID=A0ABU1AIG3_9BACT|nr:class I SAM-dependent methyltransferase [Coraliomargarita sp. SDUM461004]MDQ8193418.1 class I SAM-dependent methyltransferase [Coraliomargarita sp. SDUM461004]